VIAYSRSQFELLLNAKVNWRASTYCERPTVDGLNADLWQQDEAGESFAVLTEGEWAERCVDD
jgi:hypothetical protein